MTNQQQPNMTCLSFYSMTQCLLRPAQRPVKFQTLSLNEPLPLEHYRDDDYKDADNGDKVLSREARTQAKLASAACSPSLSTSAVRSD